MRQDQLTQVLRAACTKRFYRIPQVISSIRGQVSADQPETCTVQQQLREMLLCQTACGDGSVTAWRILPSGSEAAHGCFPATRYPAPHPNPIIAQYNSVCVCVCVCVCMGVQNTKFDFRYEMPFL